MSVIPTDEDLRTRLNRETARIPWRDLQRFFAGGMVLGVKPGQDLVEVAAGLAEDDTASVARWLEQGVLFQPDDQLAKQWLHRDGEVWAVVVAPWVLVQESRDPVGEGGSQE